MTEVKLDNNGYWLDMDVDTIPEWQWCKEQFGWINNNKDPDYWQGGINWSTVDFRFNNPMHATMFVLKWAR